MQIEGNPYGATGKTLREEKQSTMVGRVKENAEQEGLI